MKTPTAPVVMARYKLILPSRRKEFGDLPIRDGSCAGVRTATFRLPPSDALEVAFAEVAVVGD